MKPHKCRALGTVSRRAARGGLVQYETPLGVFTGGRLVCPDELDESGDDDELTGEPVETDGAAVVAGSAGDGGFTS